MTTRATTRTAPKTPEGIAREKAQPAGEVPRARSRTTGPLKPAQVDALIAGYQSGRTMKELAAELGINRLTVSAHLRRAQVTTRQGCLDREQTVEAREGIARSALCPPCEVRAQACRLFRQALRHVHTSPAAIAAVMAPVSVGTWAATSRMPPYAPSAPSSSTSPSSYPTVVRMVRFAAHAPHIWRYTQDQRSSSPSGRITPDHTDDRSSRCRREALTIIRISADLSRRNGVLPTTVADEAMSSRAGARPRLGHA
jgi:DNA-binding CsgD family transcriptional regulator